MVSSKLVFLKNSGFILIVAMLLVFSATIPTVTATQEDNPEFEAPEIVDDQLAEPPQVRSNELILNQVNSELDPQFVMADEKVIPRLDLTRYDDGVPLEIPVPNHFPLVSTTSGNSRANEDLEITNMEFGVKNSGWNHSFDYGSYPGNQGYHGSFLVGSPTTITVTVQNNGPGTVNNVVVNFTIYDYTKLLWEGRFVPGMQVPTTKIINSINSGQTGQASYVWTPPFASEFAITAQVDWPTDPEMMLKVEWVPGHIAVAVSMIGIAPTRPRTRARTPTRHPGPGTKASTAARTSTGIVIYVHWYHQHWISVILKPAKHLRAIYIWIMLLAMQRF
jgi:hypothetical protein